MKLIILILGLVFSFSAHAANSAYVLVEGVNTTLISVDSPYRHLPRRGTVAIRSYYGTILRYINLDDYYYYYYDCLPIRRMNHPYNNSSTWFTNYMCLIVYSSRM